MNRSPSRTRQGLFHNLSIVFYDTKKLVYFKNKIFPENNRKKVCTNEILNLKVSYFIIASYSVS